MSARRVRLPADGWAELRDVRQVPERLRRPLLALHVRVAAFVDPERLAALQQADTATALATLGPDMAVALEVMSQLNDLMIVAMVGEWSYEAPVTVEAVLDLPGEAYDRLRLAVAPYVTDLIPDFSPTPEKAGPTKA